MKDTIESLEKFIYDIVGLVIPGAILLTGVWLLFANNLNILPGYDIVDSNFYWLLLISLSYALGHAVTSLFHMKWFGSFLSILRKIPLINSITPVTIKSIEKIEDEIILDECFNNFRDAYLGNKTKIRISGNNLHYWRNIAITMVPDHQWKFTKFMFISMLNFGIALVILILLFFYGLFHLVAIIVATFHVNNWPLIVIICMVFLIIPFLERGASFYNRTMKLPFSIAIEYINEKKEAIDIRNGENNIRKVYLAGGFHSGWQDKIISGIEGLLYFDARMHNYDDPEKYTDWDLNAIKNADLVFAYFEETNPSGYGLTLEVGFAKALNIPVILVDEKSQKDTGFLRKLGMLHASSSVVFDNFEDGYNHLLMISQM